MRPIRKLCFQNAAGDRRGLNGETGVFASSLSGFGFSLSPSFSDLSRGFFPVVKDDNEPQNKLAITITFTKSPYTAFQSFVDWLAASGTLTVVYDPTGSQEYYRDVTVDYIQKGELNQVGWLELLCSFSCKTPWYLPTPTALSVSAGGSKERRRYAYRYTKDLRYGADSTASLRALIAGTGHIPGALTLTVRGALVNPRIALVGNVSGNTYGTCQLAAVLEDSDTLIFSTRYENGFVRCVRGDGTEEDLLDCLELILNPFFHIPVNEPCTLSVRSDASISGRAELLIFYYYRSV